MSFFGIFFAGIQLSYNGESIQFSTIKSDWVWILLQFLGGNYYNFFEAKATSISKNPSMVSIIGSFEIPLNYLIDIYMFKAEFRYESLAGSLIVMISLIVSMANKQETKTVNVSKYEQEIKK